MFTLLYRAVHCTTDIVVFCTLYNISIHHCTHYTMYTSFFKCITVSFTNKWWFTGLAAVRCSVAKILLRVEVHVFVKYCLSLAWQWHWYINTVQCRTLTALPTLNSTALDCPALHCTSLPCITVYLPECVLHVSISHTSIEQQLCSGECTLQ